jgi:CRISPR-associated endonuclease/helicase Cas3
MAMPPTDFAQLSPIAHAPWAKSGEPTGHGLLAHLLDVAAVAETVLRLAPEQTLAWAASAFALPVDHTARTVAAWVGLHDLGKATPGFQAKWPAGRAADERAGLVFFPGDGRRDRHDLSSLLYLDQLLRPHAGGRAAARALAAAVSAHHGYFFDPGNADGARNAAEHSTWSQARSEIVHAYLVVLQPESPAPVFDATLPALAWLAGLTSLADWIGSNTDWFPPGERHPTLSGHHAAALQLASLALRALGWPAHRPLLTQPTAPDELVARIVGVPGGQARPLQAAADRLLDGTTEPVLLIAEAPMGEGKTELALLSHLRLQAALGHRGLFIGLPTQATGTAMFRRAVAFLRAFGEDGPLDIQLAHGGALLAMEDASLVALRNVWGEAGDHVRSSTWFSQRRRALLSPYGVGTIDQALLATLNTKHHFVRLWGLANRVVVLDEVHAYDTYTTRLIEALLRWLKALRCSVVLMSATLPRATRARLLAAWGVDPGAAPELAYPRVLVANSGGTHGEHFASRELAPVMVQPLTEDLATLADAAEALVRQGGCGAVVVNTVDRAQQLWLVMRERLAGMLEPMLFHARFPADERQQREQAVLATFGRDGQRPPAALLVATQVVEQSLDIDFDFLVTDLAPVDLVLQRAGRLHRHERPRPPAHHQPCLRVAGLQPDRLPELKATGWKFYGEYTLLRTWAFLSRESVLHFPQDIDRLVQTVYGDEPLPPDLPAAWARLIDEQAIGAHQADQQHQALLAKCIALHADDEFQNAYNGRWQGSDEGVFAEQRNATRLGADSVVIVPVHADGGTWRLHPSGPAFDPAQLPDDELARAIVRRQLRVARTDVVKALRAQELAPGWAQHPWLRDVYPLALVGSCVKLGATTVRLDPGLGLLYAKAQPAAPGGEP